MSEAEDRLLKAQLKAYTAEISRYARVYEYDEDRMPQEALERLKYLRRECKKVKSIPYPTDKNLMREAISKAEKLL